MADCYVGEIRPFPGTVVPSGWKVCDGSLIRIADYQALYSLIGTSFGGDGVSTFGLPDLRGRLPIGSGPNYPLASKGGSESATLNDSNMPPHTHAFAVTTSAATSNSPVNNIFANPAPHQFYATTPTPGSAVQVLNADTVPASGGNNIPHENRMPALALNYIIALLGEYPTRN